ncbi:hypothetical protein ACLB2K_045048 [Fragaria x ananassa]
MNGKVGTPFSPTCGLRQGDPLSPYLFLLVTEVLSYLMVNSSEKGELNDIHLSPNGLGITHLFFADDSLFFLKADEINCLRLKIILDDYCSASGQESLFGASGCTTVPAASEPSNLIAQRLSSSVAVVSANEELVKLPEDVAALQNSEEEDSHDDDAGEKLAEMYNQLQLMRSDAAEAQASKILAGLEQWREMEGVRVCMDLVPVSVRH